MLEIDHGAAYSFARDFSVGLVSTHQTPIYIPWGEIIPPEQDFYLGQIRLIRPNGLVDLISDDRSPLLTDSEMVRILASRLSQSYVQEILSEGNKSDRFLIGLILSAQGEGTLPPVVGEALGAHVKKGLEILHEYRHWDVCSNAEGYMAKSMENGGTLLVDDTLLVKDVGYSVGIAVDNIVTPTGTFFKGAWYRPVQGTRKQIEKTLRTDNGELEVGGGSKWVYVRDSSMYRDKHKFEELLARVDDQVRLHRQGQVVRDPSKSRLTTEF